MQNFPPNIAEDNFSYERLEPEERDAVLKNMKLYFDLCSEEYDLWENNMLEERIWRKWEAGIKYAFSKKAYRDGWEIIKEDAYYYKEFHDWVEYEALGKESID